jgi:hypothetical protein
VRRALAVIAVAVVCWACTADPYPLITPAGASDWSPAAIGEARRGAVLFLQLHPGDRIELVSAEAVGMQAGADVTFYFAPPVPNGLGGETIGDVLQPLAGATWSADPSATEGPGNDVGLIAEIVARQAGTFDIHLVRVAFKLNGGATQIKEGITQTFTVCAADPAPSACGPTPPA